MNKQDIILKIESVIDNNNFYIQEVENGWDVFDLKAQNEVLIEVLYWVKELK